MSPRPRKASDDEIFLATQRVMSRAGPRDLTLAMIAAEAGLTAGALVQRFGGKLELLRALMARFAGESPAMFAAIRAAHRSPLAALHDYAGCMARMAESPAELAHHLSWLQLDLSDPEMRRHLGAEAKVARQQIAAWLDEAVAARELRRGTDTRALARTAQVAISGSLMGSATEEERAAAAMRRDLDAVLAPYLARKAEPKQKRRGGGRV